VSPRPGLYRHYKGGRYLVYALTHDADDADRTTVLYLPLDRDPALPGPALAVRTADTFTEVVCAMPGCTSYGRACPRAEHEVERFTFVRELREQERLVLPC
jgi:hypothetical protein